MTHLGVNEEGRRDGNNRGDKASNILCFAAVLKSIYQTDGNDFINIKYSPTVSHATIHIDIAVLVILVGV